jgi:hypothetical protein
VRRPRRRKWVKDAVAVPMVIAVVAVGTEEGVEGAVAVVKILVHRAGMGIVATATVVASPTTGLTTTAVRSPRRMSMLFAAQEEESSLLLVTLDLVNTQDPGKLGGNNVTGRDVVLGVHVAGLVTYPVAACAKDGDVVQGGVASAAPKHKIVGKIGDVQKIVHIVEEKVYATLGDGGEHVTYRWVLDTGASNHMSGSRVAFSSIDNRMIGTVRFADGLVVNIEGVGTVLYECKIGERKALTNVYFIP